MSDDVFELMAKQHGSPLIARADIGKFTGGAISPKYCANMDSLGEGPEGRFMVGRRVVYKVDEFLTWLREHSKPATGGKG